MSALVIICGLALLAAAFVCLGTSHYAMTRRRYKGWTALFFLAGAVGVVVLHVGLNMASA